MAMTRHAAVPPRMAHEGNQEDIVPRVQGPHALEAEPVLPLPLPDIPLRAVPPMQGAVAALLFHAAAPHGRLVLGPENVDFRMGKIGNPARVVQVEMRGNEVPDVAGLEAEPFNLAEGRRLGVLDRPHGALEEETQAAAQVGHVGRTKARVHEDEPLV